MFSARFASVIAAASIFATPAIAAENVVQPSPSPAPSAGPTLAAAQAFCGEASGKANDLIARYSADSKLKQVYKSSDFVAFADDEKNPTLMYTFTAANHPAHPSAVCRKIVKVGEAAVIKMEIVCDGAAEPCNKLRNDFNVLTAKMQAEVDQRIAAGKK
jgi:hypothetical protein